MKSLDESNGEHSILKTSRNPNDAFAPSQLYEQQKV